MAGLKWRFQVEVKVRRIAVARTPEGLSKSTNVSVKCGFKQILDGDNFASLTGYF